MGNLCFGIDLGSNNLKLYCKEGDRIIQQKNMVAVENKKKMIDMVEGIVVSYGGLARIGFRLETNYYASE